MAKVGPGRPQHVRFHGEGGAGRVAAGRQKGTKGSRYDRRAQEHRLEAGRADRTQRSSDDASPGPHGQDGRGWTESEPPADDRRGECLL